MMRVCFPRRLVVVVCLIAPGRPTTKNLGLGENPNRLHDAIRNGFGQADRPAFREIWRNQSGLPDRDRELIALNFFLYSKRGVSDDFVLCDTLVELALRKAFEPQFSKLAVFALNLSNSGSWHGSGAWPSGALTEWANLLIRQSAWNGHDWTAGVFDKAALLSFINAHVGAHENTAKKIRNNYHFYLKNSGLLLGKRLEPMDYTCTWVLLAPQLFWDRQIFDGKLSSSSSQADFERAFLEQEIYKLLRCSLDQGLATARVAFREYSKDRMHSRFEQLETLAPKLGAAA